MRLSMWWLLWLYSKLGKKMYVIKQQSVKLADEFSDTDRIIDLGGGGEGIIGQLRGKQVTAVDLRKEELDEAPDGPIKVVADARALPFSDNSFDAVTAFYFLMYVPVADHSTVMREAYRVLRTGGSMYIWDAVIPEIGERKQKLFVIPVKAILPAKTVYTAYGVQWKGRTMNSGSIATAAREAGFHIQESHDNKGSFILKLKK